MSVATNRLHAAVLLLLGLAVLPEALAEACGALTECAGECTPEGVCDLGTCTGDDPDVLLLPGSLDSAQLEPGLDMCIEDAFNTCSEKATASVQFTIPAETTVSLRAGPCSDVAAGGFTSNETYMSLNRINENEPRTCVAKDRSGCDSPDQASLIPTYLDAGTYQINLCDFDGRSEFTLAFSKTPTTLCGGVADCPNCIEGNVCSLGTCTGDDPDVKLIPGIVGGLSGLEPGLDDCFIQSEQNCQDKPVASVRFTIDEGTTMRVDAGPCPDIVEDAGANFDTFATLNRVESDGAHTCVARDDLGCDGRNSVSRLNTAGLPAGTYQINVCGFDFYEGTFTLGFDKSPPLSGSCGGLTECIGGICTDGICDLGTLGSTSVTLDGELASGGIVEPGVDACTPEDAGLDAYKLDEDRCLNKPVVSVAFTIGEGTTVSLESGTCETSDGNESSTISAGGFDTFFTLNRINEGGPRSCVAAFGGGDGCAIDARISTDLPAGRYQINVCGRDSYERGALQLTLDATVEGGVQGDPHMTGFDGSHFDYNGEPGAVFSVVATPDFQVNAMLMPDLAEGLTYVGALGITSATGHTASVRAAVVADRLVVVLDDVVEELDGAGAQGGDIHLAAVGHGDVEVSVPGLLMVVEVHRSIFLNIKSVRLTAAHPVIDGVLGETARPGRSVTAGIEHEESHYFVHSLLAHTMAEKPRSRKMGAALEVGSNAEGGAAAMVNVGY